MGMFKRRQAPPATSVGGNLLTPWERERVDALWRLTALPRDGFEATYGVLLARFWRYVSAAKGEAWTALRSEALTAAVAALRARQARVLPRFAAAEDAARLAEVMSFALAAAVVAERFGLVAGRASAPGWCPLTADVPAEAVLADRSVPRAYGALLLPRLAGETGLGWLAQERIALDALAAYFGGGPSDLRAIAEQAETRVGLPLAREGVSEGAPEGGCVADDEAVASASTDGQSTTDAQSQEDIGGEAAGWRWVNWVRAGLADGSIAVNAASGWLHNIAGEAYVVVPEGFEAFAALEGVAVGTLRNRVVRLGRHRERSTRSGAANTFRAELPDGRRVDGMVFPGELIWEADAPPEATGKLGPRRR
ncbi:MAG: hypothetical protein OXH15_11315 [Gammaproteobacteria bacterium]|nr:hypothetical protein [Gammaproteobacteria bacterium]